MNEYPNGSGPSCRWCGAPLYGAFCNQCGRPAGYPLAIRPEPAQGPGPGWPPDPRWQAPRHSPAGLISLIVAGFLALVLFVAIPIGVVVHTMLRSPGIMRDPGGSNGYYGEFYNRDDDSSSSGDYYDPYDEYNDPYGDYYDPYGEYYDPYGDYYDPYGEYNDPYGDYYDPYGDYYDPYGDYYDPYGEYNDPYGDYYDPYSDYYGDYYDEYSYPSNETLATRVDVLSTTRSETSDADGRLLLLVEVALTNVDSTPITYDTAGFELALSSGILLSPLTEGPSYDAATALGAGRLLPDGHTSGTVAFLIPAEDYSLTLFFSDSNYGDYVMIPIV